MTAEIVQPDGEIKRVPYPGTEGAPTDDPLDYGHMVKISAMIKDLREILGQFGDTCIYVRRRGVAWGATAMRYRDDDKKYGLFDLVAQHERDILQRIEQIDRLKARISELESTATTATLARDLMQVSLTKANEALSRAMDGAFQQSHDIALAIDSGRGNEREIATAILSLKSKDA